MRMHVQMDERQLRRALEKAGKRFGDTTEQAVLRWGVQTCRELAKDTQVHGKTSKAKKKQQDAIMGSMLAMVAPLKAMKVRGKTVRGIWNGKPVSFPVSRLLKDASEINQFIESKRNQKGRTPKSIPIEEKRCCSLAQFNKARRIRYQAAGAAKGPWLGVGQKLARLQRGAGQIKIGKNFLGYAQKHAKYGDARPPRGMLNPTAFLVNKVSHVGNPYVLKKGAIFNAIRWGAINTLKWYRAAARAALKKA